MHLCLVETVRVAVLFVSYLFICEDKVFKKVPRDLSLLEHEDVQKIKTEKF